MAFAKPLPFRAKIISFCSKTVPQPWVVGFCPKQNMAGVGVGGRLDGGGSKETLVGPDRAGMGSYLAGSSSLPGC